MVELRDNQIIADRTVQLVQAVLTQNIVVSNTFSRMSDDVFRGRAGDAVTLRVQKPLPARSYPLYNDRAQPLKMDFLEEALVTLNVEKDRMYSAVGLRDEVRDFDFQGNYGELIAAQGKALASKFELNAKSIMDTAPLEYVKYVDYSEKAIKDAMALGQNVLFNALVDARTALQRMGSPLLDTATYAVAGSAWASAFRKDQRLTLATGNNTPTAFSDASIGTYAGITIVEDVTMNPDELFLYTGEAFLAWTAAPGIPQGAVRASQANQDNLSLLWIQDYDANYAVDRSIAHAYSAFGYTKDFIEVLGTDNQGRVSDDQYFIRGAKLMLGAATDAAKNVEPGNGKGTGPGAVADSFLAKRYRGERVDAEADRSVFTDLTYQNIVDGKVKAGSAGDLGTTDSIVKKTSRSKDATPAPEGDAGRK